MLIIDEYEREETRQVYVDLNNNIEVSDSKKLNILNRSFLSRVIALLDVRIINLLTCDYIQ